MFNNIFQWTFIREMIGSCEWAIDAGAVIISPTMSQKTLGRVRNGVSKKTNENLPTCYTVVFKSIWPGGGQGTGWPKFYLWPLAVGPGHKPKFRPSRHSVKTDFLQKSGKGHAKSRGSRACTVLD